MEQKSKILLSIDGKEIIAEEGMTILEAAQQNNIRIPTLCHHPALSNWGGCRICVVEVDGAPKLVASCVMPVRNGMEVVTSNERIIESRRMILEFLFAERNHHCMFCPQSGDCELQKLAYELQIDHLTVSPTSREFPADMSSNYMGLDHNRCILCGRCVRACGEIAGNYVLNYQNRGSRSLVVLDLNMTREASTCYSCGVCMQVCPTGAIYNRYRTHYAVKGHTTKRQTIESVCPQCGLLCPTICSVDNNTLLKVEGNLIDSNGRPDHGQLCYKGRFEIFKSMGKRSIHPMFRKDDGSWSEESWGNALDIVAKRLSSIRRENGGEALFGLVSSAVSNEELIFFSDLMTKGFSAGHVDTLDGNNFEAISRCLVQGGQHFKEASWKMIPQADFIMVLGANPFQSQPLILSLIRKCIQEKGTPVAIIGQADRVPPLTAYHFAVKNGDVSLMIQAILAKTIASGKNSFRNGRRKPPGQTGKVNVPRILKKLGFDEAAGKAIDNVAGLLAGSSNPLFLVGTGITSPGDSSGLSHMLNLALLKDLLPGDRLRLIILKPYGNSAGAWKFVPAPRKRSNSKDSLKGGLILLGGEEALDGAILHRLDRMDFIAVLSPYFEENLADKAHMFIPKPLWTEEDGTYTSLDGCEISNKKKILAPPAGIKSSWQTLSLLAERSGFHSGFNSWSDLSKEAERRFYQENT